MIPPHWAVNYVFRETMMRIILLTLLNLNIGFARPRMAHRAAHTVIAASNGARHRSARVSRESAIEEAKIDEVLQAKYKRFSDYEIKQKLLKKTSSV